MFDLINLFWFMISTVEVMMIILIPIVIIKCTRKPRAAGEGEEENAMKMQPFLNTSAREIKNDATDASNKSERDGKKLELSNIRDSIRVAKLNQQRNNSPKNNRKKDESTKKKVTTTKQIYTTKSVESQSKSQAPPSTTMAESSVKVKSLESLTDEIVVPVGKTSRAPVPQSSLTSLNNLKTHEKGKSEVAVKFGDERISAKRTKPISEAV